MKMLPSLRLVTALAPLMVLASCGGGGGGGSSHAPSPVPAPAPTPTPAPASSYTVGVTVSGLAGTGLVLRNNGGNDLAISANGAATFSTALAAGAAYAVTVAAQPGTPAQNCVVGAGSGTIASANVGNVTIICTTRRFAVGVNVDGLGSGSVTFANGGDSLTVSSNGRTTFTNTYLDLSSYSVTVSTQPVDYGCSVADGPGALAGDDVYLTVHCVVRPPSAPVVTVGNALKQARLSWTAAARAEYYRVWRANSTAGPWTQLGTSLTTRSYTDAISVHLLDWLNARYRIEACNVSGCTDSAAVAPGDSRAATGYIKASNTERDDWFGLAVAVSGDGKTLAVSSIVESSDATTVNGAQDNNNRPWSGAVYVYSCDAAGTWSQQAYLKSSPGFMNMEMGFDLALSTDGNTLVAGAPYEDGLATQSGAAYVFVRTGSTWVQQARLKAHNAGQEDYFGFSVDIRGDGNSIVVGAPRESSDERGIGGTGQFNNGPNSGAAYVFGRSGSAWTEQTYIKASNTTNSAEFGISVAMSTDGSTLAIGQQNDHSDGINGDQDNYNALGSGSVLVFARTASSWAQQAYLKAPNLNLRALNGAGYFGANVALSGDGNTLAVSTVMEDGNARGIDGAPTAASAQESGAAYVFARSGTSWSPQAYIKASNADAHDYFGAAIDISDDGDTMVIGAYGEASAAQAAEKNPDDNSVGLRGAAYVFRRNGTSWQETGIMHANREGRSNFGYLRSTVAISGDGQAMAVGAYVEGGSATGINGTVDDAAPTSGAAYLF